MGHGLAWVSNIEGARRLVLWLELTTSIPPPATSSRPWYWLISNGHLSAYFSSLAETIQLDIFKMWMEVNIRTENFKGPEEIWKNLSWGSKSLIKCKRHV